MIVCHCLAVNDRQIDWAVEDGALDVAAVSACTRAGTDCGGCLALVADVIDEAIASRWSVAS